MTAISESVKQRDLKQTMQVLIPLEPLTLTYIKVSKTVYEFTRIRTGTLLYPDVLGLVIDVEPLSEVTKIGGIGKTMKRRITLINSSYESILLTLWGDMATNEGDVIERMREERPIVALSKVKISTYAGVLSLSSISITTLQVDPSIPSAKAIRERFNQKLGKKPGTTTWGKNKESVE
ncbi:hypothetical protein Vadar_010411 [Vaccinium darrowii]|uniref:Uncharacterized protein n=1 Tax=Vaccinium darrowii TaxID=229202 RepID=A0ACB7WZP9_9ERIC|nr:hypothetical protein Vadar_010411 [Vaccinium darrowii]